MRDEPNSTQFAAYAVSGGTIIQLILSNSIRSTQASAFDFFVSHNTPTTHTKTLVRSLHLVGTGSVRSVCIGLIQLYWNLRCSYVVSNHCTQPVFCAAVIATKMESQQLIECFDRKYRTVNFTTRNVSSFSVIYINIRHFH